MIIFLIDIVILLKRWIRYEIDYLIILNKMRIIFLVKAGVIGYGKKFGESDIEVNTKEEEDKIIIKIKVSRA